jgi:hypothetical protein
MRASAFLYPWDVVGDPGAADQIASLGVEAVTVASAYHSTRALTPRHPDHRIVSAQHSAVYYPPDTDRWAGRTLRPYQQSWMPGPDPYGEAAAHLAAAGLQVHTWVVLAHNSRLGMEHPGSTVRNAYGDRYPWAPCIARPEVVRYCADLAAEAAVRPGAAGTDLESCGWYGLAHLHAHDKIAGVPLDGAALYLMSLCFCEVCDAAYTELGAPDLASAVRAALAPVWAGRTTGEGPEWARVRELLGADLAELTLRHRLGGTRRFQQACVDAVRRSAPPGFRIMLHADPALHRSGPNPGVEVDWLLGLADGLVLPCSGTAQDRIAVLSEAASYRLDGTVLAANLAIVAGLGGRPEGVAQAARQAAAHGADELRLHHAGLAGDADLAAVREGLAAVRELPCAR